MEVADSDELGGDYVPLILTTMAEMKDTQRKLAVRTGISKSRLGALLHGDPGCQSSEHLAQLAA